MTHNKQIQILYLNLLLILFLKPNETNLNFPLNNGLVKNSATNNIVSKHLSEGSDC